VSAGWNAEGGDETEDEIWGKISKVKSWKFFVKFMNNSKVKKYFKIIIKIIIKLNNYYFTKFLIFCHF
jgi:hypothetical protein